MELTVFPMEGCECIPVYIKNNNRSSYSWKGVLVVSPLHGINHLEACVPCSGPQRPVGSQKLQEAGAVSSWWGGELSEQLSSDRDTHPEFCPASSRHRCPHGRSFSAAQGWRPGVGPAPSKMVQQARSQARQGTQGGQQGLPPQRAAKAGTGRATEEKEVPGKGGSS